MIQQSSDLHHFSQRNFETVTGYFLFWSENHYLWSFSKIRLFFLSYAGVWDID